MRWLDQTYTNEGGYEWDYIYCQRSWDHLSDGTEAFLCPPLETTNQLSKFRYIIGHRWRQGLLSLPTYQTMPNRSLFFIQCLLPDHSKRFWVQYFDLKLGVLSRSNWCLVSYFCKQTQLGGKTWVISGLNPLGNWLFSWRGICQEGARCIRS